MVAGGFIMEPYLTSLGGLGLFLLGMVLLTDGLRKLAGDALHEWLSRFTRSVRTGAVTGTVATAVLQSSSATTVTVVGFVAAGLLTFPQALGVIFGANLGTTITGWMVALLGFKLKIGVAALPAILAGALLRLFGHSAWRHAGLAVAGFGLVFLGIEFLQQGLSSIQAWVTPALFPPDTLVGRLLLVAMGGLLVVLTQSSSAGVALAMTALSLGAISFPQAAALVIGMDVGTTVTAVLASLGSSEAARRTGFSHTIYNLFTAALALALLDAYVFLVEAAAPGIVAREPELVLVGFHTLFNLVALLVGLPLAGQFARLMERLVPSVAERLSRRLDDRLIAEPRAAMAALGQTLEDECRYMLQGLLHALDERAPRPASSVEDVERDLRETRTFIDRLNRSPDTEAVGDGLVHSIHAIDHLRRMLGRLQQKERIHTLRTSSDLAERCDALRLLVRARLRALDDDRGADSDGAAEELAQTLQRTLDEDRDRVISRAVEQDLGVAETGRWLAARRWLERMAWHVWRAGVHLDHVQASRGEG